MIEPDHKPLPTQKDRFSLKGRIASFGYAFSGLAQVMKTEHNAWIHLCAAILVVTAGAMLKISTDDWTWIIIAIGWVWTAELFNTAIERLCDAVSPHFHPSIGAAKDIAAAGVLVTAFGAAIIGVLRLGPYFVALISP